MAERKSIMIAEDDDDTRRLLKMWLEDGGYEVIEARDGASLLEKLKKEKPDVLLLDLIMPGMGPEEISKSLAEDHTDLKVLYLSGMESKKEARQKEFSVEIGSPVCGFLLKPVKKRELLMEIKKALGGKPP